MGFGKPSNRPKFKPPREAKKYERINNTVLYVPVDRIHARKWAKIRNVTFEQLLLELKDNFNAPYVVKIKWMDEPKKFKWGYYTIYTATLDISGDYFIMERANDDEITQDKPKLVMPQYEVARLIQLGVLEVYRRRKTNKEYREEKELHEITTW